MVIKEVMVLETTLKGTIEKAIMVGISLIMEFTSENAPRMESQFIPYSFIYAGKIKYTLVKTDTTMVTMLPIISPVTAPFLVFLC